MNVPGRRWLRIIVVGLVLLYLTERVLVATANANFVPSVILLGTFLMPVVFVTFLYERLPDWKVPIGSLATYFLCGGSVGTLVAGTLEYNLLQSLGVFALLGVGPIEEGAKLIFPLIFFSRDATARKRPGYCSAWPRRWGSPRSKRWVKRSSPFFSPQGASARSTRCCSSAA